MPPRRTPDPRHLPLALLLLAVFSAVSMPRLAARGTLVPDFASARLREVPRPDRRAAGAKSQSPRPLHQLEGDESAAPSQAPKGGGAAAAPRLSDAALEQAMLAAEDSRAEDDAALAPLRAGLKGDARLQTLAVRALGRFERASLVPEIAAMLDSPVASVRAEAANALGQAVLRGEAGPASIPLTTRARTESDARVLAALARTLGRLPYQQESEVRDAERTILAIADRAATAAAAAEAPTDRGATPGESEATARRPATAPATAAAAPAAAEAPPDRVTKATATATERATTLRRGAPNELAATPSDETIILAGEIGRAHV